MCLVFVKINIKSDSIKLAKLKYIFVQNINYHIIKKQLFTNEELQK